MKKILSIFLSVSVFGFGEVDLPRSIDSFAHIYQENLSKEENTLFSPYSLFSCLGGAFIGSSGETAQQMAKTLQFSGDRFLFSRESKELKAMLTSPELEIADALWVESSFQVNPEYQELLSYESKGFSKNSPIESSQKVNDWVEDATHGKIKELLSPGHITADTRVLLTNAIHFSDQFLFPFNKNKTTEKPFFGGKTSAALMMQKTGPAWYFEDDQIQALFLPMKSERFGTFFILPKTSLKELDPISIVDTFAAAKSAVVYTEVPKFSLELDSNPVSILQKMGMKKAFSSSAEFSHISEGEHLKIDDVIHKATFAIDESGVEATAATGITFGVTSITPLPPVEAYFIADRPFLFGILDLKSDLVLFLGQLVNPAGSDHAICD